MEFVHRFSPNAIENSLSSSKETVFSNIFTVLLCLIPILLPYKFLVLDYSLATVIVLSLSLLSVLVLLTSNCRIRFAITFIPIILLVYIAISATTKEIVLYLALIPFLILLSKQRGGQGFESPWIHHKCTLP